MNNAVCLREPPSFYSVLVVDTDAAMIAGNDDLQIEREEDEEEYEDVA